MSEVLTTEDLTKYPFLKESQEFIKENTGNLKNYLKSENGKKSVLLAEKRLSDAIILNEDFYHLDLPCEKNAIKVYLGGYALSRIIASCMGERSFIDRIAKYESNLAANYFVEEEENKRKFLGKKVNLNLESLKIPVTQYIEMVAYLHENRWRLVNRDINAGLVSINKIESEELFREKVRFIIRDSLPLKVPEDICAHFYESIKKLKKNYQDKILEDFGEIEESSFPPCIQDLISAVTTGKNLTHPARFAMTTFLLAIGMSTTQVVEIFTRAPDFDLSKTQYQVEHISGRSGTGTEYNAPSCAFLETNGLCIKRDTICIDMKHPLNYYRKKKFKGVKKEGKKEPTSPSD
jgi:DNA primase large subunit